MYVLVLVLEQVEKLPKILKDLVQIGLTGTTVLDSTGMGRLLMEWEVSDPLLEFIKKVLSDKKKTNKTLFTVINEEKALKKAISTVKSNTGDLNEHGKGILFAIPIAFAEGVNKHIPPIMTEDKAEETPDLEPI
jgi:nitrogen regulatory protein PII